MPVRLRVGRQNLRHRPTGCVRESERRHPLQALQDLLGWRTFGSDLGNIVLDDLIAAAAGRDMVLRRL